MDFMLDILIPQKEIKKLDLKECFIEWGNEKFSHEPAKYMSGSTLVFEKVTDLQYYSRVLETNIENGNYIALILKGKELSELEFLINGKSGELKENPLLCFLESLLKLTNFYILLLREDEVISEKHLVKNAKELRCALCESLKWDSPKDVLIVKGEAMSSLESVEKKQNIRFPKGYIKLVQADFKIINKKIQMENDIVTITKVITATEINILLDEFYDLWGYDIVPVVETDCQDYICLYYKNDRQNPAIVYWNYEMALENPAEGFWILYENIDEFLEEMQKDEIMRENMYVKRVFFDDLSNRENFEQELNLPEWEEIEELIDRLNGKTVTQITMDSGVEDNYFCIGGGNEGLYNIFISENDNETIWSLINSASIHDTYKLVTGGQEGEFEGRLCVTIDMAKKAAKHYCETGGRYGGFSWEK